MDVENLDALTPAELDALLEQALNPRVPVEVLYAVLERIGARAPEPSQPQPHPQVPPRGAATDRAVRPERPRPPKTPPTPPTSQPPQIPPMNAMPGPGPGAPGPNPNMQQTTVIPIVPSAPPHDAAPTAVIPIVPSNAPNTPPAAAPNAAPPSRGAHAPMRHPNPQNPESGY